jgi:hypothetical protein
MCSIPFCFSLVMLYLPKLRQLRLALVSRQFTLLISRVRITLHVSVSVSDRAV